MLLCVPIVRMTINTLQLDSWWYYKGDGDGVKNWTARPDIFPNGIDSMVKKTGWRPVAHNRWWYVILCIYVQLPGLVL